MSSHSPGGVRHAVDRVVVACAKSLGARLSRSSRKLLLNVISPLGAALSAFCSDSDSPLSALTAAGAELQRASNELRRPTSYYLSAAFVTAVSQTLHDRVMPGIEQLSPEDRVCLDRLVDSKVAAHNEMVSRNAKALKELLAKPNEARETGAKITDRLAEAGMRSFMVSTNVAYVQEADARRAETLLQDVTGASVRVSHEKIGKSEQQLSDQREHGTAGLFICASDKEERCYCVAAGHNRPIANLSGR